MARKATVKKQPGVKKRPGVTQAAPEAKRISALDHAMRYGRFGADCAGGPGVKLSLRHPISIVTVIARKGKAKALSAALHKHYGCAAPGPGKSAGARGLSVLWCGPEQWYVIRQARDGALCADLARKLDGLASVSDQSHGRVIFSLSGARVRDVLAKGTPVDFHPRVFAPGDCAVTQMAHVGVHIVQTGTDAFELSLFRGFSEHFWEWLTEMSLEFGYEVV